MKIKKLLAPLLALPILSTSVYAHCPLCVVGAAAATGGALWLGVSKVVVALFLGAFAVAVGWWIARIIKKQYVPQQKAILVISSYLMTLLPILPILDQTYPFYLTLFGGYGTLFNRVYLLNLSLFSSILGGIIIIAGPPLSETLSKFRNGKFLPFQGIIITLVLLLMIGVVLQLAI